jgi:hypothetical protein
MKPGDVFIVRDNVSSWAYPHVPGVINIKSGTLFTIISVNKIIEGWNGKRNIILVNNKLYHITSNATVWPIERIC